MMSHSGSSSASARYIPRYFVEPEVCLLLFAACGRRLNKLPVYVFILCGGETYSSTSWSIVFILSLVFEMYYSLKDSEMHHESLNRGSRIAAKINSSSSLYLYNLFCADDLSVWIILLLYLLDMLWSWFLKVTVSGTASLPLEVLSLCISKEASWNGYAIVHNSWLCFRSYAFSLKEHSK